MRRVTESKLLFLVSLCIFSAPFHSLSARDVPRAQQPPSPLVGQQIFLESLQGSTRLRVDREGNIYILNRNDSSILAYDKHFALLRRVGSFGQGPKDLNRPSDFAIDRFGNLVVADKGNDAIKVFSKDGSLVRNFRQEKIYSVDVLSNGDIVAVSERDNQLIRVLSPDGHLVRYVGEPVPTDSEKLSPRLHIYLNRGVLLVDWQDNIFWVGGRLPTPMIRKYSQQGELLLQFQPSGQTIESVAARARQQLADKLQTNTVGAVGTLNGIHVDRRTGEIWVMPAAPGLLIYDSLGNLKRNLTMEAGPYVSVGAWDLLILDRERFIISNSVIGCYLFSLRKTLPVRWRKR